MTVSAWLRVVRIKFLFASIIAVFVGLSVQWWQTYDVDIFHAGLTFAGVLALHASVDLLNDYWDFKRGIDSSTKRTKMSGGTGVLPKGLLKPSHVYYAGIIFLIVGSLIGTYFVMTSGITIAILLAFAILSIYFYSGKIVDSGLGEVFVAIKGTMIVLGTFFIQSNELAVTAALAGIVVGVLSSLVLFVASFPDHDADKSKGRRTLVILLGKEKAVNIFWIFLLVAYSTIIVGNILNYFPVVTLIALVTIPFAIKSGLLFKQNFDKIDELVPAISNTLIFSRITGSLLAVGFFVSAVY